MANAKKTWISIVIAGVIVVVILGVTAVGSMAFLVYRHVNARFVPTDTAAGEFARARERFVGQQPLIELTSDEVLDADEEPHVRIRARVHRERERGPSGEITALHVLTYDRRAGKLVRVDLPRWLLQIASAGGHIRIANLDMLQGDKERITLDDLDRHGPGLVLDVRRLRGAEVLVWTD